METFLKRTYNQAGNTREDSRPSNKKTYPFWDYRSRRGSESTYHSTSSGVSSCSSSEAGVRGAGMLRDSIREEWNGQSTMPQSVETHNKAFADMASLKTSLPDVRLPAPMMSVTFMDPKGRPEDLVDTYNPILDWVDRDLRLFNVSDFNDVMDDVCPPQVAGTLDMPSVAIIVFLQEEEMIGDDRLSKAKDHFSRAPWKFHHSEWVSAYHIQAYEYNSHDYYLPADDLPLCSVRQIHCGGEHLRVVRFVTAHNWQDTINFYKLILGQDPAFVKLDFCVFTIESHPNFDVQFAIKKLPRGVVPRHSARAVLTIRIPDITPLAPLLPVTCTHVGGSLWTTRDLDGNQILLDVIPKDRLTTLNHQVGNIRATTDLPKRLTPRVELPPEEQARLKFSSHCKPSHHREHRSRHAKPPKSHKNQFVHAGSGSSFRPVKHRHQRTDSGFIEGPRHDILTDIAIDAISKLGQKVTFFSSEQDAEDSPPDSPWESQSSASNSEVQFLHPGLPRGRGVPGITIPSNMDGLPPPDWSPNHESGFGDTSDLESIREYPIDCRAMLSVHQDQSENDGDRDSDSQQGEPLPLGSHRTLENLAANWSGGSVTNSDSEESVKRSPYTLDKPNMTDTGSIHNDIKQQETILDKTDGDGTNSADQSIVYDEVNSFLESLKQREIRRDYASRIGAHGTLLSSADKSGNNTSAANTIASLQTHYMEQTQQRSDSTLSERVNDSAARTRNRQLDRTKLPPPPVPPKPKTIPVDAYSHSNSTVAHVQSILGITSLQSHDRITNRKVQKHVTFNDDISVRVGEFGDPDTCTETEEEDEPMGFWI